MWCGLAGNRCTLVNMIFERFRREKWGPPSPELPKHKRDAITIIHTLESEATQAQTVCNSAKSENIGAISVREAFSENTAALIERVFGDNENFLAAQIREWADIRLEATIERRGDHWFLVFSEKKVDDLLRPNQPKDDGTGE